MMKPGHTHEEFVAYLEETIKPGNDQLCCLLQEARKCALCKHPVCKEHSPDGFYCIRCRAWLLNE